MAATEPLKLKGAPGSPYTRKMLAYLRFRHIRYELLLGSPEDELNLPRPRVELLPTFYLPNEQGELTAQVDSTPLIRRFETEFAGRHALPDDPALAFLNELIEDYADEWLTKAMFHYRWHYAADIDQAGTILPMWRGIQESPEQLAKLKTFFAERQINRLYVVGSNATTAPIIEASYERFLGIMDTLLQAHPFVLGERPASADFALYAQLTQLAKFDPTPAALCLQKAPRVYAWTDIVDDLSGQAAGDNGWLAIENSKASLAPLLTEIGRTYVPAMLANARALQAGQDTMTATIDGQPWEQPTFPYQGKCLQWLNEAYQALPGSAQTQVDQVLRGTGCEALILNATA